MSYVNLKKALIVAGKCSHLSRHTNYSVYWTEWQGKTSGLMTRSHDSGVEAQQCCRPHIPITALSRSWGCFLFGSQSWLSTDSKAFGSGPLRIKCSRNLGNNNNNVYFMGLRLGYKMKLSDEGSPRQLYCVFSCLYFILSYNTLHYILLCVCVRIQNEQCCHKWWWWRWRKVMDGKHGHLAAARVSATHASLFCVTRTASSTFSNISGFPA